MPSLPQPSRTTVDSPQALLRRGGAYAQAFISVNMSQTQTVQSGVTYHSRPDVSHIHEEAIPIPVHVHERAQAVNDQRQLRQFVLLVGLALLFIPLGYSIRGINEANTMNVLQIMAVFVVEGVKMFPWI
ncbi:hypothetical protein BDD12DRAFT_874151 [Trichophaea hybrida]|nr:hypothetical protein BDD12DRAFT_874151 [Trichophaea hybrida]